MSFQSKEYGKTFAKGLIRDVEAHKKFKAAATKRKPRTAGALPSRVDLSKKVSPPEDQGQCGSCWDFSITKALRSSLMLVGKDPGRLAFNYLLNNCGPGPRQYGCGGGDFDAGQSMLHGKGPWLEAQDPYTQQDGNSCKNLPVAATALDWVLVGDGNGPPTFQELAEALAANHMLSVDVAADNEWSGYSNGIYNAQGSRGINHMINCVGYNMETSVDAQGNALFDAHGMPVNGDGYLIVMNNWGTVWGENGYMKTRWGCNAIAETAMYFKQDVPVPPTPPVPPVPPIPPTPSHGVEIPVWLLVAGSIALVGTGVAIGLLIPRK